MPHVLVVGRVVEEGLAVLRARPDVTFDRIDEGDPEAVRALLPKADGLLVRTMKMPPDLLDTAPNLRVVSRHGVGYDNLDVGYLVQRRIPLAIAATSNAVSVAEHAFWMMLELAKRGREHEQALRSGNWAWRLGNHAIELGGRRVLLVGCGRTGRELARRALAFDMTVDVFDPFAEAPEGCRKVEELEPALGDADFVSLHLPRTAATVNLFNAAMLARMRPGAVLVNTARGGIVDERALAEALASGHLRGAGLDVFDQEPPAPGNPLLAAPNVLLTPHTAGVTAEAMLRMAIESAVNVLAGIDGKLDPGVVVNREVLT
ncbi:MAG TPA: hydroxyacid dehydrogenase [Geminicoccus sp.]|jgi:D-3-phosphoglycerate dehydrogenase|uniref:hydroxyacid dehydrogenase n=1 Tax=Geminicoccus sp. TaxID=2024832 RepID=UPI002E3042DF|nr:hydroxyacid dehydrogenase [Geminicoccus sp.]HEX2529746.1 hydroxyacid dehydrogenase [Geminicoccus sp.]